MVSRIVSVVKPVHEAALTFLPEAFASLRAQELPDGWEWEWLVQVDGGNAADVPAGVSEDSRVKVSDNRRGGPGVARTLAWDRSRGELVKVLDSDDILPAGALARDIAIMEAHPTVGWTVCRADDLMPDGSLQHNTLGDPEPGLLALGELYAYWATTHRPGVHPATLCIRESLLAEAGGWMALPASEDTALLLALDVMADGWFIGETGLHYRKHAAQTTAHPDHRAGDEWDALIGAIRKRVNALAVRHPPA